MDCGTTTGQAFHLVEKEHDKSINKVAVRCGKGKVGEGLLRVSRLRLRSWVVSKKYVHHLSILVSTCCLCQCKESAPPEIGLEVHSCIGAVLLGVVLAGLYWFGPYIVVIISAHDSR